MKFHNLSIPALNSYSEYEKPKRKQIVNTIKKSPRPPSAKNPVAQAIDQPYIVKDDAVIPVIRPPATLPPAFTHQRAVLDNFLLEMKEKKPQKKISSPPATETETLGLKFNRDVLIERAPLEKIVETIQATQEKPQRKSLIGSLLRVGESLEKVKITSKTTHEVADEIPSNIMRMQQLDQLIAQHKEMIASERNKAPEVKQERFVIDDKSGSVGSRQIIGTPSRRTAKVMVPASEQSTLSSMTVQTLMKLASESKKTTSQEAHTSLERITLELMSENKTSEELLKMYLLGTHVRIEDISGLERFRHERLISKRGNLATADQVINEIESGRLLNFQKRENFLDKPVIWEHLDETLVEKPEAKKQNDQFNNINSSPETLKNAGFYLQAADDGKRYNQRLVTLLSYMIRAGLMNIVLEYDGKDPSYFEEHLRLLNKVKTRPNPNSKEYQHMMALLNKIIIYTSAAVQCAEKDTERDLVQALRTEAVHTLWDLRGMSFMSRWCRKGFKESLQHMMTSTVSHERYMGALIQANCVEVDSKSVGILLEFLVDTDREAMVTQSINDIFHKNEFDRLTVLTEINNAFKLVDFKLKIKLIELATSLVEQTPKTAIEAILEYAELGNYKKIEKTIQFDIINQIREIFIVLVTFMWSDWNPQVQLESKNALVKLGLQKLVEYSIIDRIKDSKDQKTQLEALGLFISSPIDAPRVQPTLVECLNQADSQIRQYACQAAAELQIIDNRALIRAIISQCSDDHAMIRYHAMRALEKAAGISEMAQVKEILYFTLHYEKFDNVKMQAITIIQKAGLTESMQESLLAILPYQSLNVKKAIEAVMTKQGIFHFTGDRRNSTMGEINHSGVNQKVIFRPSVYESRSQTEKQIILRDQLVEDNERQRLIERVSQLSTKNNIISEATHMVYKELELRPLKKAQKEDPHASLIT